MEFLKHDNNINVVFFNPCNLVYKKELVKHEILFQSI